MGALVAKSRSVLEWSFADEDGGPSYIPISRNDSSNHVPLREDRRHGA